MSLGFEGCIQPKGEPTCAGDERRGPCTHARGRAVLAIYGGGETAHAG